MDHGAVAKGRGTLEPAGAFASDFSSDITAPLPPGLSSSNLVGARSVLRWTEDLSGEIISLDLDAITPSAWQGDHVASKIDDDSLVAATFPLTEVLACVRERIEHTSFRVLMRLITNPASREEHRLEGIEWLVKTAGLSPSLLEPVGATVHRYGIPGIGTQKGLYVMSVTAPRTLADLVAGTTEVLILAVQQYARGAERLVRIRITGNPDRGEVEAYLSFPDEDRMFDLFNGSFSPPSAPTFADAFRRVETVLNALRRNGFSNVYEAYSGRAPTGEGEILLLGDFLPSQLHSLHSGSPGRSIEPRSRSRYGPVEIDTTFETEHYPQHVSIRVQSTGDDGSVVGVTLDLPTRSKSMPERVSHFANTLRAAAECGYVTVVTEECAKLIRSFGVDPVQVRLHVRQELSAGARAVLDYVSHYFGSHHIFLGVPDGYPFVQKSTAETFAHYALGRNQFYLLKQGAVVGTPDICEFSLDANLRGEVRLISRMGGVEVFVLNEVSKKNPSGRIRELCGIAREFLDSDVPSRDAFLPCLASRSSSPLPAEQREREAPWFKSLVRLAESFERAIKVRQKLEVDGLWNRCQLKLLPNGYRCLYVFPHTSSGEKHSTFVAIVFAQNGCHSIWCSAGDRRNLGELRGAVLYRRHFRSDEAILPLMATLVDLRPDSKLVQLRCDLFQKHFGSRGLMATLGPLDPNPELNAFYRDDLLGTLLRQLWRGYEFLRRLGI